MRGTVSSSTMLKQHRANFMSIVSQEHPARFAAQLFSDVEQQQLINVGGRAAAGSSMARGDENDENASQRHQPTPNWTPAAGAKPRTAEEDRQLMRMLWTVMRVVAP